MGLHTFELGKFCNGVLNTAKKTNKKVKCISYITAKIVVCDKQTNHIQSSRNCGIPLFHLFHSTSFRFSLNRIIQYYLFFILMTLLALLLGNNYQLEVSCEQPAFGIQFNSRHRTDSLRQTVWMHFPDSSSITVKSKSQIAFDVASGSTA